MKFLYLFFSIVLFTQQSIAQIGNQKKLVIKPGLSISYGFNYIKDRLTAESSFTSPKPGFTATLNGRIEYYWKENTFLDFTIKGSELAFSFGYSNNVFSYSHQTGIEVTQLNLDYNHYISNERQIFKKITISNVGIKPKVGFGFGISKNPTLKHYEFYLTNNFFGSSSPTVTHWRMYTIRPDNKVGLNAFARLGFSMFRNNKELFDLVLEYNKGLTNMATMNLEYNINGTSYNTILGSRGTNINLTAGIPITLFRFK